MSDKKEIEKIYEANKKIELHHSLKENPPISGGVAKKLINNSKRALAIVNKYHTAHCEKSLREGIEMMEDELASKGKISVLTYNMDVRNYIHLAVLWVDRWTRKGVYDESSND